MEIETIILGITSFYINIVVIFGIIFIFNRVMRDTEVDLLQKLLIITAFIVVNSVMYNIVFLTFGTFAVAHFHTKIKIGKSE